MSDAARKMAKALTPAQRKALLALPRSGDPLVRWIAPTGTREALLRKRLVARWMVTRSAEDWRADPDPAWKPQYTHSLFDAHSLTMSRPTGFARAPSGCVSGAEVVAVLLETPAP
jgi:hypothetical protein